MALITAKYSSICAICSGSIRPGTSVEWSAGSKARHAACVQGAAQSARPAPKARKSRTRNVRREPAPAPPPGCTTLCNRSGYSVGAVVHAPKVAPIGGGPDGCYWVVLSVEFVRADEDSGHYDDLYHACCRPASEAECADKIAAARSKGARVAVEAWLTGRLDWDAPGVTNVSDTGTLPPPVEVEVSVKLGRKTGTSGAVTDGGTTYALTATAVVAHHGGYHDDYRSSTRTVTRTDELAQVIAALASNDEGAIMVCADRIEAGG